MHEFRLGGSDNYTFIRKLTNWSRECIIFNDEWLALEFIVDLNTYAPPFKRVETSELI